MVRRLDYRSIDVAVNSGVVLLRGYTTTPVSRARAEGVAQDVRGVLAVTNQIVTDGEIQITTENKGGRRITRWADEQVREAMAERVHANPALLNQRKELIEHVFGTIKRSMDQGYFLLRTRKKVAAEMSLTVLAYNLRRVITILGVKGLMTGLMEHMASLWSIVWWLMSVPQWCKRIRRTAGWDREPAHQPTFHTVWRRVGPRIDHSVRLLAYHITPVGSQPTLRPYAESHVHRPFNSADAQTQAAGTGGRASCLRW